MTAVNLRSYIDGQIHSLEWIMVKQQDLISQAGKYANIGSYRDKLEHELKYCLKQLKKERRSLKEESK